MKRVLHWLGILAAIVSFAAVAAHATETITYTYDALGRLISAQTSGGVNDGQSVSTAFDAAGNRTNYTVTGAGKLSIANAAATEGSDLVFTVTLSSAASTAVTVNYASADGTATSPGDYSAVSGTLTFNPGETSKTITVSTVDDSVVEAAETMAVTLSSPSGAAITTASATGTINDNDVPALTIADATAAEGGNLVFTVTLSSAAVTPVTVDYASANGTAISPGDYSAASGTLTFNAGETSKTITVATVDDAAVEAAETMAVTLSNPAGATIATATGTGTINDNDVAQLAIADASVTEGGNLAFAVTLSAAAPTTVTVNYLSTNGTATAGSDYTAVSGTLTFNPGETSKTIIVATTDDTAVESSETMTVTLSSPIGATIATATGTGTINDNDVAAANLAIGNASVTEGGTLSFTVTRSGNTGIAASASYASASGTATSGSDFTAASGTVSFAAGETSKMITVATTDDSTVESTETMTVTLSSPSANATITTATGTGTINDNDASLAIGNASATEGGTLSFTVTRTGTTTGASSASYATASGTATSGSDFTAASGTVSFAAGETSKTITVATTDDTTVESAETMTVTLSGPVGATIATASGTGTINDNDTALAIGNASATEGGTLTFTVTRTGVTTGTSSASYATASGTATSGSDFTAASGTVSFAAGETSKTITVATTDDSTVESSETLTVTLSSPVGATIVTATGTGTINDNDVASANLAIGSASATEGGTLSFTVTRSGNTGIAASASYASASGTATSGSDFTAASGTVSFAAGETTKTVTVATIDDSTSESVETMTVTLSSPSANATITTATGTGTINDNDASPTQIFINSTSVTEGGTLSFYVGRNGNISGTGSVTYASSPGTATAGADYTSVSGTVNFAAGQSYVLVNVPTIDDATTESNETMTMTLSNPVGGTITTGTATGTINDNDGAPTVFINSTSVNEGGNLSFYVGRGPNISSPASVNYTSSPGTATAGADYTSVSGTVNFAAGQSYVLVNVPTIDDALVESNETMTMTLSNAVGATITTGTATGTINDNDGAPTIFINSTSVAEGGTLSFYIGRGPNTSSSTTVSYASSPGTATAGTDYTSVSGTVTLAAGQSYVLVNVPTIDDALVEPNETMTMTLSNPIGSTITTGTATGTINNND